jgi:hypothetical protein
MEFILLYIKAMDFKRLAIRPSHPVLFPAPAFSLPYHSIGLPGIKDRRIAGKFLSTRNAGVSLPILHFGAEGCCLGIILLHLHWQVAYAMQHQLKLNDGVILYRSSGPQESCMLHVFQMQVFIQADTDNLTMPLSNF